MWTRSPGTTSPGESAGARPWRGRSALLVPCERSFHSSVLGSLAQGEISPGLRAQGQGRLGAKSLALVWNRKTWKEQGDPERRGKRGPLCGKEGEGQAGAGGRGGGLQANGVDGSGLGCVPQPERTPPCSLPRPASLAPG